jgi:RNA polymerase sigma factor (sigma-70 family)
VTAHDHRDAWAFVAENRETLRRYARRLCVATPLDHEDVLNEAVMAMVMRWEQFCDNDDRGVLNHAVRTIRDTRSAMGRKLYRTRGRERAAGLVGDLTRHERPDPTSGDALDGVEGPPLEALLVGLTDSEREVLVVRSLDRTFSEIGAILDMSYDQVRGAFYRGRAKMEKALRAHGEGSS